MALNAAVTPDGGEIGRAQAAQAEAARARPHVDMNPILLKPETDSASQVVVLGASIGARCIADYHTKKPELRGVVGDALDRLARSTTSSSSKAPDPRRNEPQGGDLVNMCVAEAPMRRSCS